MRRPAVWMLIGVLAAAAALTLGPLPRRALSLVADAVALSTGLPSSQLRAPVEAVSNVIMFAILAVALMAAIPRLSALLAVVLLASASVGVEATQGLLLHGRHAEPQDVLLNTAGAVIGTCAVVLARSRRASHSRSR